MTTPHFQPVDTKVRFPAIEDAILGFWKEHDTFKRSVAATEDKTPYVFFDGPPFATGLPHYGHLLAGTLKDIVPRYWTMRGFHVPRRFGWDCHGLPVENEMEKEFNVSGKRDIEKIGLHLFNEACRSIVLRYTGQWEDVVLRMGRWVDFANQYRTMDPEYMESIWWAFRQVYEKDLIYQGFRVQPYCPRCATPLSNFEVNEGYRDVKGPSITVTFPLADDPAVKILVWTTTPWTLPSNVVLAVGQDIEYVKVRDGSDFFILAQDRLGAYYRSESEYEIVERLPGSALVGLRYQPLFEYFSEVSTDFFQVIDAEFVSTEDGTGIVHIAPAFGEDDFQVGRKMDLPIICPVDDEGRFTADVPEWQGKLVFDADSEITAAIKKAGRLVHKSTVEHRYPFCYRCDAALIYKAITTWFMKIEPLKPVMLENNRQIHWVPSHLQNGRFGKGVESAPDWNISRNRYWGTPLPVWLCECGHFECAGSLDDLHDLVGRGDREKGRAAHARAASEVQDKARSEARATFAENGIDPGWADRIERTEISPVDLHPHVVDTLEVICPKCGSLMRRTPEVLDCWFESGSMPYAQSHYPFENADAFLTGFPADFIAEGLDQTRGWFYTLTVLSAALFGKPAFKNVVVNGIILSEDGKKLSKRLRNYTPPQEVLEKLGADALRLFLINSPAVKAEDLCFSEKGVTEMSRAVLLPFWNAYAFFVTYANVDGWSPGAVKTPSSASELDQWIVSLLNHVVRSVNSEMEQYNLYRVVPVLVDFIDNLTNWYIRRSRRRFWKSENDADKNEAYETLYYVLVIFSRVMAPFLPFLTEAIYRNLVAGAEGDADTSVHLTPFPSADTSLDRPDLEEKMATVRRVVTMGRAVRSRDQIKVRQPLGELTVVIRDPARRALVQDMAGLVKEELNVKKVTFDDNEDSFVSVSAKPNYKKLGKVFGPKMKEAAAAIGRLSHGQVRGLEAGDRITVCDREIGFDDIEVRRTQHEGVDVETQGDITIGLNTDITDALREEGHARELVNRIQNMRKSADFNVTDRITVACQCPDELKNAVEQHRDYICAETLATSLNWRIPPAASSPEKIDINGIEALLWVARAEAKA
ncbi:MAG: isoleucine--tRNA ligase [Chitinivibrionales bacterium]|nr:isoleucine--tRNA ligase [Chitinivibrionales bacterium]MBD3395350.1 isoleucine--tRNA ligase [Chitinivibrionales bacterium]